MKKHYLLIAIFLLVTQFASAQFTLSGEFRPRTELGGSGGPFTLTPATPGGSSALEGSDPFIKTSVRAALNAKYKTDSYTFYLGLQEVFFFGDRTQISAASNGNFRVQEAWVDLKLADAWSLKLGRQPLSYDDQRILGGLGWAQQARTHDVLVFKHKKNDFSFDAGYALNTNEGNIYPTANLFSYRELGFLHANKKFGNYSISGLFLGNVYQAGDENKAGLITAGIHAKAKFDKLGLALNGYIQNGDRISGDGLTDVAVEAAYLLSLNANYKVNDKVNLMAGGEIISGKTDDSAAFFPLYGTNHKFNGLIDRFYVGNHGNASGLVDLNLGAKFVVGKGASLLVRGHHFTEESIDKNTIGQEIDLVFAKKFKGFKLVAGYSQFFESDEFYDTDANKSSQNWAWAMLIVKPKFLGGAKKKIAPKKM